MRLRDVVHLSVRTLLAGPLEAILELGAIAVGVAPFSSSLSLIQYYARDIEEAAEVAKAGKSLEAVRGRTEDARSAAIRHDYSVRDAQEEIGLEGERVVTSSYQDILVHKEISVVPAGGARSDTTPANP